MVTRFMVTTFLYLNLCTLQGNAGNSRRTVYLYPPGSWNIAITKTTHFTIRSGERCAESYVRLKYCHHGACPILSDQNSMLFRQPCPYAPLHQGKSPEISGQRHNGEDDGTPQGVGDDDGKQVADAPVHGPPEGASDGGGTDKHKIE